MRAFITLEGNHVRYQEGALATLRPPADLIPRFAQAGRLSQGSVMFGGMLAAIGGVRPANRLEMELADPVLGRTIRHTYNIWPLPVVS